MLADAFIETREFQLLRSDQTQTLVVGRRGSGKSALFLQLEAAFRQETDVLVFSLRPEEHQIQGLRAAIRAAPGSDASYDAIRALMKVVWRAVFLASIESRLNVGTAPSWLSGDPTTTAIEIIEGLDATEGEQLVHRAAIATGMDTREKHVREALTERSKRVLILADGIDEGWQDDELALGIVGGLCHCFADLTDRATNVAGLAFLRDNIYRLLNEKDKDASRTLSGARRLSWDQPTLFMLVTTRLRVLLPGSKGNDLAIWNRFAQRELSGHDGFATCLRSTLYRPRDVLELLNSALQTAQRLGREAIIPTDLNAAVAEISSNRLSDLIKEYHQVLPGIQWFVELFRARPPVAPLSDVMPLLANSSEGITSNAERTRARLGTAGGLAKALFSVGFLGVEATQGGYRFCHEGRDLDFGELLPTEMIAVHPCYSRALKIAVEDAPFDVLLVNDEYDESRPRDGRMEELLERSTAALVQELADIPVGPLGAERFENWAVRCLTLLFAGDLTNFVKHPNRDAAVRRDVVASNEAGHGPWKKLAQTYDCSQVIFEVKNVRDLEPGYYSQLAGQLGGPYGRAGFILYRAERDALDANERSHVQEQYASGRLVVLLPVTLARRWLDKQTKHDRQQYARSRIGKWIDTHERQYSRPRVGRRS